MGASVSDTSIRRIAVGSSLCDEEVYTAGARSRHPVCCTRRLISDKGLIVIIDKSFIVIVHL